MKPHIERTANAVNPLLPLAITLVCATGFHALSVAQENKSSLSTTALTHACSFNSDEKGAEPSTLTASFVEMTKPTGGYPTITDMVTFNGKLFLATSKDPLGDWGTTVFSTTDGISYTKVLSDPNSQGYLRMGVFDNKLWIPDGDPNGLDPGYVYISSTGAYGSFSQTTIIGAVHTFDVIKYSNKIFTANGMSNYQGALCKYDGANTWNSVSASSASFRMKYMAQFGGKLFVANDNPNSDVDYFVYSGDPETTAPVQKNTCTGTSMTFRWFASSQGKLFWTVAYNNGIHCLSSTDGNTWTPVPNLDGKFVSDYCELNGKMYALSQNGLWESSNFSTFTQIATVPASDPNAFMPVPMTGGYNSDGVASMEAYNGSIWCGSSISGKVYNVAIATSAPEVAVQGLAFDIYPNPFTASARFTASQPLENATMTLYSSLGQAVRTVHGLNGSSFTLDRNDLPGGLYYVQLSRNNIPVASEKIVITD